MFCHYEIFVFEVTGYLLLIKGGYSINICLFVNVCLIYRSTCLSHVVL